MNRARRPPPPPPADEQPPPLPPGRRGQMPLNNSLPPPPDDLIQPPPLPPNRDVQPPINAPAPADDIYELPDNETMPPPRPLNKEKKYHSDESAESWGSEFDDVEPPPPAPSEPQDEYEIPDVNGLTLQQEQTYEFPEPELPPPPNSEPVEPKSSFDNLKAKFGGFQGVFKTNGDGSPNKPFKSPKPPKPSPLPKPAEIKKSSITSAVQPPTTIIPLSSTPKSPGHTVTKAPQKKFSKPDDTTSGSDDQLPKRSLPNVPGDISNTAKIKVLPSLPLSGMQLRPVNAGPKHREHEDSITKHEQKHHEQNGNLSPSPLDSDGEIYDDAQSQHIHEFAHYDWFHEVDRKEGTRRLNQLARDGGYIVRVSDKHSGYTLMIYLNKVIKNLIIRRRDDKKLAIGSKYRPDEVAFDSLPELIEYHKSHFVSLVDGGGSVRLHATPRKT